MSFSRTGKSLKRLMVLESSGNLFNSSKKNMMCMADNKDNMATLWASSLLISIGCHNTKRDHFDILVSGKTDFHCCVRLKKPYLFEGELTLRSRE